MGGRQRTIRREQRPVRVQWKSGDGRKSVQEQAQRIEQRMEITSDSGVQRPVARPLAVVEEVVNERRAVVVVKKEW